MTTLYTIVEIGYEYNDEIMYQPESGGGTPLIAYSTKQRAKEEADSMNQKNIMDLIESSSMSEYGYDWGDVGLQDFADIHNLPEMYDFTVNDFKGLSEEVKNQFLQEIDLSFYEVYEVKVIDSNT